jgi:hypothetical protein
MPVFIGIDYHKAYSVYSVLDVQGESLGQGTYRSRSSGGFQRAATMAGMPGSLRSGYELALAF